MQHELRAALWRNARLAALGTVVAKVSHDLRGILTPALLTPSGCSSTPTRRCSAPARSLAQAVDRATDLVRRTLDYAREGPPPLELAPGRLGAAGERGGRDGAAAGQRLRLENAVDPAILVRADRTQLFRVLANLLRNAAEAGARRVRVSAQHNSPTLVVRHRG